MAASLALMETGTQQVRITGTMTFDSEESSRQLFQSGRKFRGEDKMQGRAVCGPCAEFSSVLLFLSLSEPWYHVHYNIW